MAKTEKIQQDYDSSAEVYDSRYSEIQRQKYRLALEDLELKEPMVDLGCGTGMLKEFLGTNLFGCDISLGMLQKAKERGMLVVQADLEHLPFKKFKTILSFTALQNVEDVKTAIKEIKQVSDGKVILTYLDKFDFTREIQKEFDILEVRKVGEDVSLLLQIA